MTDDDVEQAGRLAAATSRRCSPTRAAPSRRSACTASSASPRRSGCSAGSDSTRASPGHITARDPELTDHFWVNPFGMHFGHIRVSDLMLVDHDGEVVEGDRPVNQAAFAIHSQVHAARPDVIARRALPLDVRQVVVVARPAARPDHAGRVRVLRRPRAVRRLHRRRARPRGGQAHRARARRRTRRSILRNHGLLTVGHSVDEAAWWFITMERVLPGAAAGRGRGHAGAHRRLRWPSTLRAGRHPLRGLVQLPAAVRAITREQPDLFD